MIEFFMGIGTFINSVGLYLLFHLLMWSIGVICVSCIAKEFISDILRRIFTPDPPHPRRFDTTPDRETREAVKRIESKLGNLEKSVKSSDNED